MKKKKTWSLSLTPHPLENNHQPNSNSSINSEHIQVFLIESSASSISAKTVLVLVWPVLPGPLAERWSSENICRVNSSDHQQRSELTARSPPINSFVSCSHALGPDICPLLAPLIVSWQQSINGKWLSTHCFRNLLQRECKHVFNYLSAQEGWKLIDMINLCLCLGFPWNWSWDKYCSGGSLFGCWPWEGDQNIPVGEKQRRKPKKNGILQPAATVGDWSAHPQGSCRMQDGKGGKSSSIC